ncbi:MAG: insulinase family protein [Firmicutes bacterium]|nr:insulinase family protein [Bacillota bacterium]
MFQTAMLTEGCRLHVLPTRKFKTVTCKVFIQHQLGSEATETALVPQIIARGSRRLPTMQHIASHLADLYGARFGAGVLKLGEYQLIDYYFEIADGSYLGQNGEKLLRQGMDALAELITQPRVEGSGFYKPFVEQEVSNLRNQIRSIIDNKRSYALKRFIEIMFEGEPFAIYKYGRLEGLDTVSDSELLTHYRSLLAQNPIEIFVVGNIDHGALHRQWQNAIGELRNGFRPLSIDARSHTPKELKTVVEQEQLRQGILFLGYRVPITYSSPDYYKLLVYSGVLGGFPHAKLFRNVREKASLAYYVFARVDGNKGFLMINAGIPPSRYNEALEIILQEVDALDAGSVTSWELEQTKRGLVNSFLTMEDSAISIIDRGIVEATQDVRRKAEDVIEAIKAVTVEDLVEIGEQLQLDTIYFLQGEEGENAFQGGMD